MRQFDGAGCNYGAMCAHEEMELYHRLDKTYNLTSSKAQETRKYDEKEKYEV
jgi:hypothetical protein